MFFFFVVPSILLILTQSGCELCEYNRDLPVMQSRNRDTFSNSNVIHLKFESLYIVTLITIIHRSCNIANKPFPSIISEVQKTPVPIKTTICSGDGANF